MSDRPTPEQIAGWNPHGITAWQFSHFAEALRSAGYVIAHPDNHPVSADHGDDRTYWQNGYADGWNELHWRIFGGS